MPEEFYLLLELFFVALDTVAVLRPIRAKTFAFFWSTTGLVFTALLVLGLLAFLLQKNC